MNQPCWVFLVGNHILGFLLRRNSDAVRLSHPNSLKFASVIQHRIVFRKPDSNCLPDAKVTMKGNSGGFNVEMQLWLSRIIQKKANRFATVRLDIYSIVFLIKDLHFSHSCEEAGGNFIQGDRLFRQSFGGGQNIA